MHMAVQNAVRPGSAANIKEFCLNSGKWLLNFPFTYNAIHPLASINWSWENPQQFECFF